MKKIIFSLMIVGFFSIQLHAGFFSSFAASAIANDMSKGSIPSSRLEKINAYLWNMHEKQHYDEGYNYYLEYLEKHTENISWLDTVAIVYLDNKNKKKALEIYRKRILPWIILEDKKTQNKFKRYYENIKKHK